MIGWSVINPALLDLFTAIAVNHKKAGIERFRAEWVDGKRGVINPDQGFSVALKVTTVSAIGKDETRETFENDDVTETQTGQRKFTLQVQVLAVANGADFDWAMAVTERARTRLTSRRIVDQLLDIDVDIIDATRPSMYQPYKDGGRVLSSATMDVVFGCTASEDDPIPAGWLQYLVISSHLRDLDDTELPPSLQMVNVEVPAIP